MERVEKMERQAAEEQQAEIMARYDREAAFRRLKGPPAAFVGAVALCWALFHLYTAAFGVFPPTLQRAPHVGFALLLIYLLYPFRRGDRSNRIPFYDYVLALLSVAVASYHVVFYEPLINRAGGYTTLDTIVSVAAIILILEATRRIAGPVLMTLALLFLIYAYFGPYFPGFLSHRGFSFSRIVTHGWLSTEGILGVPIQVSSTFIFLFLLFAAFLKKTGIGEWLTSLAIGLTGGATGGPAKAAVIASACQGTISGSSVANVVGTGSVTIPLMKSIGYRKEFAGAVEAAASTGGQLMPPIMGAAAFIMSQFTGIPYIQIAAAAAIPAVLYFTGVFVMVHLEAKKTGLKGIAKEELPRVGKLLRQKWFLLIPIFGIVYFLVAGFTPMLAAFYGILLTVAVSFVSRDTRLTPLQIVQGLVEGARTAMPVAAACATAGIIVGIITLTGLGLKMSYGIVQLSGGQIYLTMLLTMVASIILGMGVPTTANYIIQATVAAPALVAVGVPLLAAHLFVFYFGIVADITPPVALAAFAASGIARSEPFRTGFEASKLAFAAYLCPYVFALSPVLVLINVTPLEIVRASATAVVGMVGIGAGVAGYLATRSRPWERLFLVAGGVLMVDPGSGSDLIGLAILAFVFLLQRRRLARETISTST
ncbi:MAG: TRAP transporter permease [Bacillota bacterium]